MYIEAKDKKTPAHSDATKKKEKENFRDLYEKSQFDWKLQKDDQHQFCWNRKMQNRYF